MVSGMGKTAALVNVDEVQANRVVFDTNLTWAGFTDF
jgi:FKBP-type peptidyl-prolyl cis-trans isomerase 2